MLTASQIQDTNIVELYLDGEVEAKDIETARSEVSSTLEDHDKIRLLLVYEELGSMGPKAIWEDTKLETSIFQNAERMAVVSEKRWIEELSEKLGSSTSMEIENFEPGQRDEALAWLRS